MEKGWQYNFTKFCVYRKEHYLCRCEVCVKSCKNLKVGSIINVKSFLYDLIKDVDYKLEKIMNCNLENLTEQEFKILVELLKGKSNKEIAQVCVITSHTVKAHLKNILQKTNLKSRCQLISSVLTNLSNVDIYSPEIIPMLQRLSSSQK